MKKLSQALLASAMALGLSALSPAYAQTMRSGPQAQKMEESVARLKGSLKEDPAADRNVIAVSATDQSDKLFAQSNRGSYVAIAAPGVDILSPAPDGKYQMSSGTSLSAAFVSGVAALMIARNPDISAADIRSTLASTARDLGPKGRDDQFGAGQADAFSAVSAVSAAPMAAASDDSARR